MKKIGIFLDEIRQPGISDREKLSKLGRNTGNMLFWESLKANLHLDVKSRWYIKNSDKLFLDEYKAFITTDLIWINQMQDFSYLNNILDILGEIPLIPISVGLQADCYKNDFIIHPETVKVLNRISEHCIIGVRGAYTAEILNKYGIKNLSIIGCPSMFMKEAGFERVNNHSESLRNVSLNFETFYRSIDVPKQNFLRYGAENGFSFVEQTDKHISEQLFSDREQFLLVGKWLEMKSRCFYNIDEWRAYIRKYDFSMGSRFHGNVVALWEGVPALFTICDSRTRELCEYYSLPHMEIEKFDDRKNIQEYYEMADYSEFHKKYPETLKKWSDFLMVNELIPKVNARVGSSEKKDRYVIFDAEHTCALFQFVILRYLKFADRKVVLAINKINFDKSEFGRALVQNGVFYKIIAFQEPVSVKGFKVSDESAITEFFDDVFSKNGMDIEDADEIVTACDVQNLFYIYSTIHNRTASFMELQAGNFADPERYEINRRFINGPQWVEDLTKQYCGLDGRGSNVKKRYLFTGSQIEFEDKDEIFDFMNEAGKLPADVKKKIASCLGAEDSSKYSRCSLMLFNSLGWSRPKTGLDMPQHYIPYLLASDYYFFDKDCVVLKDHPQTNNNFFNENIKNKFATISAEIPIEFFTMMENFHIDRLVSVNSSGNSKITKYVNEEIKIGDSYFKWYKYVHKAYATFIIDDLFSKNYRYHIYNIDNEFISNFKRIIFSSFSNGNPYGINPKILKGNIFTMVGTINQNHCGDFEYALINSDPLTKVVFWDERIEQIVSYKNKSILENIVPVVISKEALREDILDNTNEETIYFFCKDKSVREKVIGLNKQYDLVRSGLRIRISCDISRILEKKIKILEKHICRQNECIESIAKMAKNYIDEK